MTRTLLIILLFASFGLQAQSKLDSLNAEWLDISKSDSLRLNALHLMSVELSNVNPDSAYKTVAVLSKEATRLKNDFFKCQSTADSAYVFYTLGNLPMALEEFEKARKKYDQYGFVKQSAWCFKYEGICLTRMGKHDEGLKKYDFAVAQYSEVKDKEGLASTFNAIGNSKKATGKFNEAIDYFERSIKLYKEVEFDIPGFIYGNLAGSKAAMGYYDDAEKDYMTALAIAEETGNKNDLMYVLSGLTYFHLISANFDACRMYVDRQLELFKEITNPAAESYCYTVLSSIAITEGDNRTAMEFAQKAYDIRLRMNDRQGMGYAMIDMANIYSLNGNYQKAKELTEGVINDAVAQRNDMVMVYGMHALSELFVEMGKYEEALGFQKDVLEFRKRHNDQKWVAQTLVSIGKTYFEMGEMDFALGTYAEAMQNAKKLENEHQMAQIYYLFSIAYYHKGDIQTAERNAQRGYEICDRNNYRHQMSNILNVFSRLKMSSGVYYDAETYIDLLNEYTVENLRINFPVLSEKEKEVLFYDQKDNFDVIFDFTIKHGKDVPGSVERAFDNLLLLKGMMLKSYHAMSRAIQTSDDEAVKEKYHRWITLKRRISKLHQTGGQYTEIQKEADQLEKELSEISHDFLGVEAVVTTSWKEVQTKLKDEDVLVEYVRFSHQGSYRTDSVEQNLYAAFVLTKEMASPKMIKVCTEDELVSLIGHYPGTNKTYVDELYGSLSKPSNKLYNLLIKPLENEISNKSRLIVCPDGLLHKVSFDAISNESGKYLSSQYELNILGSGAELLNQYEDDAKGRNLVAGGIKYGSESTEAEVWKYLSGSAAEVAQINKILGKKSVDLLTSDLATEKEFKAKAPEASLIHIASHGFFYPNQEDVLHVTVDEDESEQNPEFRGGGNGIGMIKFVHNPDPLMRSGIVFAGANEVWSLSEDTQDDDGVLTAHEITTLDLRKTRLAVLSACETGLGDIRGSEGVYGLQRAFKMAGVQNIIMSLWQVPDKETAEFMTTFYEFYNKSDNIEESFTQTQREMSQKYDPYFWASFVLIQ